MVFFLIMSLFSAVDARPLSQEEMSKCKKVALVAGTYDPFTHGHESMGTAILKDTPFDCVVFLPTKDPPHKIAAPFKTRYEMIEAALQNEEKLFYPLWEDTQISPKEYVKKIRALTQEKTVFAVLGSDLSPQTKMFYINEFRLGPDGYIITGRGEDPEIAKAFKKKPHYVVHPAFTVSSTQARKWFVDNPAVYFSSAPKEFPDSIIRPEVSRYIADNGLYLATDGVTTRSIFRIAKTGTLNLVSDLNLYHPLREILVKLNASKTAVPEGLTVNSQVVKIQKQLGTGLTATAYTINYNGKEVVAKVANDRPHSSFSIKQDVLISQWLGLKTSINVPNIHWVDPSGAMKVADKIGGESLKDYLIRTKGVLDPEIEMQLRRTVSDALKMANKTNLKLDLSTDNLKISEGKVYLIDAGPIPPDAKLPTSFDKYLDRWGAASKVEIKKNCSNALKGLLLELRY